MVCEPLFNCCTGTNDDDVRFDDRWWATAWGCLPHTGDYGWKGVVLNCWFLSITFVGVGLSVAFLVETFLPIFAPAGGVLLLVLTTWLMFMGSRMHAKENVYQWSETMGPLLMRINIGYALGVLFMMMRRREGLDEIDDDNLSLWLTVPISASLFAVVLFTVCRDNACTLPCGGWHPEHCWPACCLCARDRKGNYTSAKKGAKGADTRTVEIVVRRDDGFRPAGSVPGLPLPLPGTANSTVPSRLRPQSSPPRAVPSDAAGGRRADQGDRGGSDSDGSTSNAARPV